MIVGIEIIVLVAVLCAIDRALAGCRARWHRRRSLPRGHRWLRRKHRRAAALQARALTQAIVGDRPDPTAHLAAGVILQPGEDSWLRVRTRLAIRSSQASWEAYGRASWTGRRTRNVVHEHPAQRWHDRVEIDWLITSLRIVGRLPGNSELLSVWWSGLTGFDINLKRNRIVLNAVNGWTGVLTGPSVVSIAIVAVAACNGLEALAVHPALKRIWRQGPPQPALPHLPEGIGPGATIIPIQARRPSA